MSNFVRNSRNLLILGVLLAVAAFALIFFVLTRAQQPGALASGPGGTPGSIVMTAPATPTVPPAPVLIARADVPVLTQFTRSDLAVRQYFRVVPMKSVTTTVPADYVHDAVGLSDILATNGVQHLNITLPAGEPLLTSELVTSTAAGTIDYSNLLNSKEVAETINVPTLNADYGSIQPSDHVDLMVTMKLGVSSRQALRHLYYNIPNVGPNATTPLNMLIEPNQAESVNTAAITSVASLLETQLSIQNVRVLNVVPNPADGSSNYTLAVNHQDALLLKWLKDTERDSSRTSNTISYDLVVRAADDYTGPHMTYNTTPILPEYLFREPSLINKFRLP